jgi:hypothetical protein
MQLGFEYRPATGYTLYVPPALRSSDAIGLGMQHHWWAEKLDELAYYRWTNNEPGGLASVGITFDASFANARAMLRHVITPLFNCSDNDIDDNDAGTSSPSTVVAATSTIDAWIVVLGIAATVMGLYEITTICGSVMATASATTFTSTVAFTSAVANSSSAACTPYVPTVSLCAPNIASFILNVIAQRHNTPQTRAPILPAFCSFVEIL